MQLLRYEGSQNDISPKANHVVQLQREHDAYVDILEATHKQEIQELKNQLGDAKLMNQNNTKSQVMHFLICYIHA